MNKPVIGQKYRHFKGNVIEVIAIAKNTEDLSEMVVYIHDEDTWVRPMEMFLSKVDKEKYPSAKQEYRFELIEE